MFSIRLVGYGIMSIVWWFLDILDIDSEFFEG